MSMHHIQQGHTYANTAKTYLVAMRETFQQIYQAPDMQTFKTLLQKWYHWVSKQTIRVWQ
jgi:hypothetical protein